MHRLLREPLLHFLFLGGLLFAIYGALNRGAPDVANEIVVTRGQLESMRAQFARTWQRPPTAEEWNGQIEGWIRDEVLYREGLALGLDRDDPLVRRRVAQKMEFMAGAQGAAAPTEAELQAWLDAHPDQYQIEARYAFRQVYFDPSRRGAGLDADVAAALAALERGAEVAGDSTMLPATLEDSPAFEVERVFGSDFALALAALPTGGWRGPLRSSFGLHLVELRARSEARPANLAEVRAAVERDLLQERSQLADADFYRRLRERYTVRIEADAEPDASSNAAAGPP